MLGTETAGSVPDGSRDYNISPEGSGHYCYCILSTIAGYVKYIKLSLVVIKKNAMNMYGVMWKVAPRFLKLVTLCR